MNEKTASLIEEIGLSKNEAKVYVALLELGECPMKPIAANSGVHRTNIYDCIKRLMEKGLVSYIRKEEKTFYHANDPEALMGFIREKEAKLNSVMPQLKLLNTLAKSKGDAAIYEGVVAVRNMLDHFLDLKKPRYVYGVPLVASKIIGDFFLEMHHKKRIGLKIPMYHIYNSDAKDRIGLLNKMKYTESRYLPSEYDSPVSTSICSDEVVLILYNEKPLVIQIKSRDIALAYKNYFDLLWKLSKK